MKKYKTSVVIPAYNEEAYLPKTLETLIKQTIPPDEIVVVDAHSEDRTVDIAESFGAKVVYAPKGNIGNSRKVGVEASSNPYVLSASADTLYEKQWLEHLVNPLMEDYHMTVGSLYLQEARPHEHISLKVLNDIGWLFFALHIPYGTADSIAFQRSFYDEIGGFKPIPTVEDIDLFKRAIKNGRLRYVKQSKAYVSPRRIRKWGAIKYTIFHLKNFLRYNLSGDVASGDEYEPVR